MGLYSEISYFPTILSLLEKDPLQVFNDLGINLISSIIFSTPEAISSWSLVVLPVIVSQPGEWVNDTELKQLGGPSSRIRDESDNDVESVIIDQINRPRSQCFHDIEHLV